MKKKIEDLLVRYFSGQLSDGEASELLAWLEGDPAHQKYLQEMAGWWAAAHVSYFTAVCDLDVCRLSGQITDSFRRTRRYTVDSGWAKVWRVAAVVLFLCALSTAAFYIGKQTAPEQRAYYETRVPRGAQSKVVLPDGSVVWVNADSSIGYHEDTRLHMRHVRLSGEAFFEVARDPNRPFVVETGEMQIHVKGTRFNVRAYEDQETIDVVLATGKVDVFSGNDSDTRYALLPNEKLAYHRQTRRVETSRVTASEYCAWKDRILKFNNQTFLELSKELERIYDVRIEIASKHLLQERFSGSFPYSSSLDEILREIDMEDTYRWTYSGNRFSISDK